MSDRRSTPRPHAPPSAALGISVASLQEVDERVWIDVIRKMDEVYSDLLQYEVALEDKNAALEETQQFVMSVLTSMSDILVVCNRNGVIEDVNRSLVDFTGCSAKELRGTSFFSLMADPASHAGARQMFASCGSEPLHDCELRLRAADGGPVPVSLNCTPRRAASGKVAGMVVTGRPVGELKRAYQALREAHEDLKRTQQQLLQSEKMASLGRLVAGVAHELNNPISFVLGNVHALRRYAGRLHQYIEAMHAGADAGQLAQLRTELRIDRVIEDLRPLLEGTIEGAERTRDIVDGLKRFSAAEREEHRVFDLVEVLQRSVRWVCKSAPAHFQVDAQLPTELLVSGSPGQLQQVAMNLVQNAVDATQDRADPRLEIRTRIENGEIVVSFRDNGVGIEPEHLPHLFDPFFTTKPVGKGIGLGLAISYGIVERHRGRLEAANADHGGAVFTLRLPLAASG